jgi:hypothetical protein
MPIGHKIFEIAIPKNIPISRPSEIFLNWFIWYANIPSGNPGSTEKFTAWMS